MILLDTHVLLWLDQGSSRLGRTAREIIESSLTDGGVGISAISLWEVAMLVEKRRIVTSLDLNAWRHDLLRTGLIEFAIDGECGIQATLLHDLPSDPADRLIVATALRQSAALITADERLLQWSGSLQRIDARI